MSQARMKNCTGNKNQTFYSHRDIFSVKMLKLQLKLEINSKTFFYLSWHFKSDFIIDFWQQHVN